MAGGCARTQKRKSRVLKPKEGVARPPERTRPSGHVSTSAMALSAAFEGLQFESHGMQPRWELSDASSIASWGRRPP